MSQFPSQGEKENPLKTAPVKDTVADSDGVVLVDGQDTGTKRVLWSSIKSTLGQLFTPLTRKINNKPLSSDVVLTGDDIATSATNGTTVSSSLSNKAASTLGQVTESDLLAWADEQTISGAFGINPSITTDGVPAIGWYIGKLDVNAGAKKITLTESNGAHRTWTNTTDAGEWTEWVPQANATLPQEYDLPLAEGWNTNDRARYRKTQEGLVVVNAILELSEGYSASDSTQIAVLPEGFRPATSFMYPVSVQDGSTRASAIVQIGTSGTIIYYGASNTTAVFRVYLNAAFFAAS